MESASVMRKKKAISVILSVLMLLVAISMTLSACNTDPTVITVSFEDIDNLKYNGQEIVPNYTSSAENVEFSTTYERYENNMWVKIESYPINAGRYRITLSYSGAGYQAFSRTQEFVIAKAVPVISSLPTASDVNYGSLLNSSLLSGGEVEGDILGTFEWATPSRIVEESRKFTVQFNPNDNVNYDRVSVNIDVVAHPVNVSFASLPTAEPISYGKTLSDATIVPGEVLFNNQAVLGVYTWQNPSLVPAATSGANYNVVFTPNNLYMNPITMAVNLTVNKATPVISVNDYPTAADISVVEKLGNSALTGGQALSNGTPVSGEFVWVDIDKTFESVGNSGLQTVRFVPLNSNNYESVEFTLAINITKGGAFIEPSKLKASDVFYNQTLVSSIISYDNNSGSVEIPAIGNSSIMVEGTFSWQESTADRLTKGADEADRQFNYTFTPFNLVNFNVTTGSVEVKILRKRVEETISSIASSIVFGQTLNSSTITLGQIRCMEIGFEQDVVSGSIEWLNKTNAPRANDNNQPNEPTSFIAVFTPSNTDEYEGINIDIPLIVNRATPIINQMPIARSLPYGTVVRASTLSGGNANVGGSFSWVNGSLNATYANRTQLAQFVPNDILNYRNVEFSIELVLTANSEWFTTPNAMVVNGAQVSNTSAATTFISLDRTAFASANVEPEAKQYLVIPQQIGIFYDTEKNEWNNSNALTVVGIAQNAFSDISQIINISLPNTVTLIGDNAFSGCINITHIRLSNTLTTIGKYAFRNCINLVNMNSGTNGYNKMPNTVTTIGEAAFYGCTSLNQLYLSDSLQYMGVGIILNCTNMMGAGSVVMNNTPNSRYIKNGDYILERKDGVNTYDIYMYLGSDSSLVMSEAISGIRSYAFSLHTGVNTLITSSNLTYIEESAFAGSVIQHIYFKNSGTALYSEKAFLDDKGYVTVYNIAGVKAYVKEASDALIWATNAGLDCVLTISSECFAIDSNGYILGLICDHQHANLTIPSEITTQNGIISVKGIGEYAFALNVPTGSNYIANPYNNLITSVFIADGVEIIRANAFASNNSIKSVILPETLISIGENAFYGVGISNIRIPASVINIGKTAFDRCDMLEQVIFGGETNLEITPLFQTNIFNNANVKVFGPQGGALEAFCSTNGLSYNQGVSYECFTYYLGTNNGIVITGMQNHICVMSHNNITIPYMIDGYIVKEIESGAFKGDLNITSMTIPRGVTQIGLGAFNGCNNLTSLTISSNNPVYKMQGSFIVANDINLHSYLSGINFSGASVSIDNSIVNIYSKAFNNASGLTSVILGTGVSYIHHDAFDYTAITSVSGNSHFSFSNGAILSDSGATLFKYLYANTAKSYYIGANIKTINAYAFNNNQHIEHINTANVESIGEYAFANMPMLKNLEINSTIKNVDAYFIKGSYSLVELYFDTNDTELSLNIDNNAFLDASTIMSVYCPNSIYIERRCNLAGKRFIKATKKDAFVYQEIPAGYRVLRIDLDYVGTNLNSIKNLVIPSYYLGKPVVEIHTNALKDYISIIESIVIPSTIKSIGTGAISDLPNLKRADFLGDIENFEDSRVFNNLKDTFVVYGEGERLETYCRDNDISFNAPNSSSIFKLGNLYESGETRTAYIIGLKSFVNPSEVTDLIIPATIGNKTIIKVHDQSFDGCDNLVTVFFTKDMEIGEMVFATGNKPLIYGPAGGLVAEYCEDNNYSFNNKQPSPALNYVIENDMAIITGFINHVCNEPHDTIVIPSTIGRYTVGGVKAGAFESCHNMTSVYFTSDIPLGISNNGSVLDIFGDSFVNGNLVVYGPYGGLIEDYFYNLDREGKQSVYYNRNSVIESFSYTVDEDGIRIRGLLAYNYTAPHDIVVPSHINGVPVYFIEPYAFSDCAYLEKIFLPADISLAIPYGSSNFYPIIPSGVSIYAPYVTYGNSAIQVYADFYNHPFNPIYIETEDEEEFISGPFVYKVTGANQVIITALANLSGNSFIFVPRTLGGMTVVDIAENVFNIPNIVVMMSANMTAFLSKAYDVFSSTAIVILPETYTAIVTYLDNKGITYNVGGVLIEDGESLELADSINIVNDAAGNISDVTLKAESALDYDDVTTLVIPFRNNGVILNVLQVGSLARFTNLKTIILPKGNFVVANNMSTNVYTAFYSEVNDNPNNIVFYSPTENTTLSGIIDRCGGGHNIERETYNFKVEYTYREEIYEIAGEIITVLVPDTAIITGLNNHSCNYAHNIVIPAYIDGVRVVKIASGAFSSCTKITFMYISDGIEIEDGALPSGIPSIYGTNLILNDNIVRLNSRDVDGNIINSAYDYIVINNYYVEIVSLIDTSVVENNSLIVPAFIDNKRVIAIRDGAFNSLVGIDNIVFISNITLQGKNVFPEGVTIYAPINSDIKQYCWANNIAYNDNTLFFTYKYDDLGNNEIAIISYEQSNTTVNHIIVIPSMINGKKVVRIANNAFTGVSNVSEVYFTVDMELGLNIFDSSLTGLKVYGPYGGYVENYCVARGIFFNELNPQNDYTYVIKTDTSIGLYTGTPYKRYAEITGLVNHASNNPHTLSVPAVIDGIDVCAIAPNAFVNSTNLESIYFASTRLIIDAASPIFHEASGKRIKVFGNAVGLANYCNSSLRSSYVSYNDSELKMVFTTELDIAYGGIAITGIKYDSISEPHDLVIPSMIGAYNVVRIASYAFFLSDGLRNVYISGTPIMGENVFNNNNPELRVYGVQQASGTVNLYPYTYCQINKIIFNDIVPESDFVTENYTVGGVNYTLITGVVNNSSYDTLYIPSYINDKSVRVKDNAFLSSNAENIYFAEDILLANITNGTLFKDTVTVYAPSGGAIHQYASQHGIKFISNAATSSELPAYEFTYQLIEGSSENIRLTGFILNDSSIDKVVVPLTIDGKNVIELGNNLFYNYTGIKRIIFSRSVSLGTNVFNPNVLELIIMAPINATSLRNYCKTNNVLFNGFIINPNQESVSISEYYSEFIVEAYGTGLKILGLKNHLCTEKHNIVVPARIYGLEVLAIGDNAFSCCNNLHDVYFLTKDSVVLGTNLFNNNNPNLVIYASDNSDVKIYANQNNLNFNMVRINADNRKILTSSSMNVLRYVINSDNELEITGLINYNSSIPHNVIIPGYIDGYKVAKIKSGAFNMSAAIEKMYIVGDPILEVASIRSTTQVYGMEGGNVESYCVAYGLVFNNRLVVNPNSTDYAFTYRLVENNAVITGLINYDTVNSFNLIIPEYIDGKKVIDIDSGAFTSVNTINAVFMVGYMSLSSLNGVFKANTVIYTPDYYTDNISDGTDNLIFNPYQIVTLSGEEYSLQFSGSINDDNTPFIYNINARRDGLIIVGIDERIKSNVNFLVIPSFINGLRVESIASQALYGLVNLKSLFIMSLDIKIEGSIVEEDTGVTIYAPYMSSLEYVYEQYSILSSYSVMGMSAMGDMVSVSLDTDDVMPVMLSSGTTINPPTPTFAFEYNIVEEGVIITGIIGDTTESSDGSGDHNLIIPQYIEGLPVIFIADFAFINYNALRKVYFTADIPVGVQLFGNNNLHLLRIYGPEDSYIEKYCSEAQITYNDVEPTIKFLYDYENTEQNTLIITGVNHTCSSACSQHSIIIPRSINNIMVVGIGADAFSTLTQLTSVKIYDNILYIGDRAFVNCCYLTEVYVYGDPVLGVNVFNRPSGSIKIYSVDPYNTVVGSPLYNYCMDNNIELADYTGSTYTTSAKYNFTIINGKAYITGYKNHSCSMPHNLIVEKYIDVVDSNGIITSYEVVKIEDGAFLDCYNMTYAFFESDVEIGGNSFNPNTVLLGVSNTNLEAYAKNNNIRFNETATIGCFNYYATKIGNEAGIIITGLKEHNCGYDHRNIVVPAYVSGKKVLAVNESLFSGANLGNIYFIADIPVLSNPGVVVNTNTLTIFAPINGIYDYFKNYAQGKNISFNTDEHNSMFTFREISGNTIYITGFASHKCEEPHDLIIPEYIGNRRVIGIDDNAFSSCINIKNVYISSPLSYIGNNAFNMGAYDLKLYSTGYDNNALEQYASKYGLSYNKSTYASCFDYTIINGTITITGLKNHICSSGHLDIVVPRYIDGLPVVSIGANAFNGASVISIRLQEGITHIGEGAFLNASRLNSVILPMSLLTIDDYAFSGATQLEYILIPRNVSYIGAYAFSDCTSLREVYLENRFIYDIEEVDFILGANAFNNNSSELNIYLPNSAEYTQGAINYLYNRFSVYHIDGIHINDTQILQQVSLSSNFIVSSINQYDVTIVSYVGDESEVIVPALIDGKRVTAIGDNAFSSKYNIVTIKMPGTITTIGRYAFYNNMVMTHIAIPNSVLSVGEGAFASNPFLTEVYFTSSPTLGANMFINGHPHGGLKIYGPIGTPLEVAVRGMGISYNQLTYVDCFTYTMSGSTVTITGLKQHNCSDAGHINVSIPDYIRGRAVIAIGDNAFLNNSTMKSLTFTDRIESIGENAFKNATALENIIILGHTVYLESGEAVTINNSDFYFSSTTKMLLRKMDYKYDENGNRIYEKNASGEPIRDALGNIIYEYVYELYVALYTENESVSIPKDVVKIKSFALNNLYNVKTLTLNDELEEIGEGALAGCDALTKLVLGRELKTIGAGALASCGNLVEIDTSKNNYFWFEKVNYANGTFTCILYNTFVINEVKSIGDTLVMYLASSTSESAEIRSNVRIIKQGAFDGVNEDISNPSLLSIYAQNDVPYPEVGAFDGLNNLATIHCTVANLLEYYCNKYDINFLVVNPHTCFNYKEEIVDGKIGIVITGMHSSDTCGASHENVIIPSYIEGLPVVKIEAYAFANNLLLKSIMLPIKLTTLGDNSFNACRNLASVVIQSPLKSIGASVFGNCTGLTEIYFKYDLADGYLIQGDILTATNTSLVIYTPDINTHLTTVFGSYRVENLEDASCFITTRVSGGVAITGIKNHICINGHSNLRIPATIMFGSVAERVVAISEDAFRDNKQIVTIRIPYSVSSIGAGAFANTTRLKEIIFEPVDGFNCIYTFDMEKGILYEEIEGSTMLKLHTYLNNNVTASLILDDYVLEIGDKAFDSCANIDVLYLNTDVTLGSNVFDNIHYIFKVYMFSTDGVGSYEYLLSDSTDMDVMSKLILLESSNNEVIIQGVKPGVTLSGIVYIPSTYNINGNNRRVSIIENDAFRNQAEIQNVIIPNTVYMVGDRAFMGCLGLRRANFLGDVASLGADIFKDTNESLMVYGPSNSNVETYMTPEITLINNIGEEIVVNISGVDYIQSDTWRNGASAFNNFIMSGGSVADNIFVNDGESYHYYNLDMYAYDGMGKDVIIPTTDALGNPITTLGAYIGTGTGSSVFNIDQYGNMVEVKRLIIPATVTLIKSNAFKNWKNLSVIVIEGENTVIEQGAFDVPRESLTVYYVKNNPTVRSALESVTASAFRVAEYNNNIRFIQWTSKENFNIKVNYVTYDGESRAEGEILSVKDKTISELIIPKYIDGIKITKIADKAFAFCDNLFTVVLPDSIREIGSQAFIECTSLRDIVIPSSVQKIGFLAFNGCTNLSNLEFTRDIDDIGSKLFGDEVQNVRVFGPATVLNELNVAVPSNIAKLCAEWGVSFNVGSPISIFITNTIDDIAYISGIKEGFTGNLITIPSYINGAKVTEIANGVFRNLLNVENVIIPEGVTRIGDYAFSGCLRLQNITLPSTLTNIGRYAFENCAYMSTINIPQGVGSISEGAFMGCTNLTSVEFEGDNNVASIGDDAFNGCIKLDNLRLPRHLMSIGERAFKDCVTLKSVNLPVALTEVGMQAFMNCASLKTIENAAGDSLEIAAGAFIGCNVTTFSNTGQSSKYNLTTSGNARILVENSSSGDTPANALHTFFSSGDVVFEIASDITAIKDFAFFGASLSEVKIGASVTSVGIGVFANCKNLKVITSTSPNYTVINSSLLIENNTRIIAYIAGSNRYSEIGTGTAGSLSLEGYEEIAPYAFAYVGSLTAVVLNTTTNLTVGHHAFYKCNNLESITINPNVSAIGDYAFADNPSLLTAYHDKLNGTISSQGEGIFSKASSNFILYTSYNEGSVFNKLLEEGVNIKKCTSVLAFKKLKVTMPGGREVYMITTIDKSYSGLSSWTEIIIPPYIDGIPVVIIGERALANDAQGNLDNVMSIYIPDTVTYIYAYAFQNLHNLKEVYIDGDATIGTKDGIETRANLFDGINGEVRIYSYPNGAVEAYVAYSNSRYEQADNEITYKLNYNEGTSVYCYSYVLSDITYIEGGITKQGVKITGLANHICVNTHAILNIPAYVDGRQVVEIGNDAFANNKEIIQVIIPNTVQRIGKFAFAGCSVLEQVLVPMSVREIGDYAFEQCVSLLNMYFESDVRGTDGTDGLGIDIFHNVSPALVMHIPRYYEVAPGVNELSAINVYIGETLAVNYITQADLFTYTMTAKGAIITGFSGANDITELNFPDYILGQKVIGIGDNAFRDNTTLLSIKLSTFVERIGSSAFSGCINMQEVIFNDYLEFIGERAFDNNINLTWLVIPSSVRTIRVGAFLGCGANTNFTLYLEGNDTYLGKVGSQLIVNNSDKVNVYCSDIYESYFAQAPNVVLNGSGSSTINESIYPDLIFRTAVNESGITIMGIKNFNDVGDVLYIPEMLNGKMVTAIGQYAFANLRNVQYVILPSTVASIGKFAFYNCTSLSYIHIPEAVRTIGEYAFANCYSLLGTISSGGWSSEVRIVGGKTYNTYPAENIIVDKMIKSDGLGGTMEIDVLNLGNNIQSIGNFAFYYCQNLKAMHIYADSGYHIGNGAFIGNEQLTTFVLSENSSYFVYDHVLYYRDFNTLYLHTYLAYNTRTSYMIPSFIYIDEGLTKAGVSYVNSYAFNDVTITNLYCARELVVGAGNPDLHVSFNALWSNMTTGTIYVPEGSETTGTGLRITIRTYSKYLTYIYNSDGTATVRGVQNLYTSAAYDIPEFTVDADQNIYTVTKIGVGAFSAQGITDGSYASITSVTMPSTIVEIMDDAFNGCLMLANISLPRNLIRIGERAFMNCRFIGSLNIPAKLQVIGTNAFSGCESIEVIKVNPSNLNYTFDDGMLYSRDKSRVLLAISSLIQNNGRLFLPETVRYIDSNAFNSIKDIVSITFNGRIEYIGDNAFAGADNLREVIFINDIVNAHAISNTAFSDVPKIMLYGGDYVRRYAALQGSAYTPLIPLGSLEKELVNIGGTVGWALKSFSDNTQESYGIPAYLEGYPVIKINSNAFMGMYSLRSILLPYTLMEIGSNAFGHCYNLESVTIPESVYSIGDYAFTYCDSLEFVKFEGNASSFAVGKGTFNNGVNIVVEQLVGHRVLQELTLKGYSGTLNYVTYGLAMIGGLNTYIVAGYVEDGYLTTLPLGIFGNPSIQRVVLGTYISVLEKDHFVQGGEVNSAVNLIGNVNYTMIGNKVYYNGGLWFVMDNGTATSLVLNDKKIYSNSLKAYTGLTSVTIGQDVEYIEEGSFRGLTNLISINVNAGNTNYMAVSNILYRIIDDGVLELVAVPYGLNIQYVNVSGEGNSWTLLTNVYVGYTVSAIADFAFSETQLIKIHIPNNITRIGTLAFYNCSQFSEIRFMRTMSINTNLFATYIKDYEILHWCNKAQCGGCDENYYPSDKVNVTVTAGTTLYRHYFYQQYSLVLDADGGLFADNSEVMYISLAYTSDIPALEIPIKDGYVFDGWYYVVNGVVGEEFDLLAMPHENINIIAVWELDE